ncbi:MAG TPA: hypothetical protein VF250_13110 [Conexibacter sp.]
MAAFPLPAGDVPPEAWTALGSLVTGALLAVLAGVLKRRSDRETHIAELLSRYRDPLLGAAFDLQSRLYNIVRRDFLEEYLDNPDPSAHAYARDSTLWVIGQYLGWTEILRREVQFLDLGEASENRRLQARLQRVAEEFATDKEALTPVFRIFRAEQRAIGELMIAPADAHGRLTCLGYAEFSARVASEPLRPWFVRLEQDLERISREPYDCPRLVRLQRALVDLVDLLDPERIRYPDADVRGRLPHLGADGHPGRTPDDRVARFVFREHEREPWVIFAHWAEHHGFATSVRGDVHWAERPMPVRRRVVVELRRDGERVEVFVRIAGGWRRRPRTRAIEDGGWLSSVRARSARDAVNDLLRRLDRPEI